MSPVANFMNETFTTDLADSSVADGSRSGAAEHFDVLIIGAGLSGIGTAFYLSRSARRKPTRSGN